MEGRPPDLYNFMGSGEAESGSEHTKDKKEKDKKKKKKAASALGPAIVSVEGRDKSLTSEAKKQETEGKFLSLLRPDKNEKTAKEALRDVKMSETDQKTLVETPADIEPMPYDYLDSGTEETTNVELSANEVAEQSSDRSGELDETEQIVELRSAETPSYDRSEVPSEAPESGEESLVDRPEESGQAEEEPDFEEQVAPEEPQTTAEDAPEDPEEPGSTTTVSNLFGGRVGNGRQIFAGARGRGAGNTPPVPTPIPTPLPGTPAGGSPPPPWGGAMPPMPQNPNIQPPNPNIVPVPVPLRPNIIIKRNNFWPGVIVGAAVEHIRHKSRERKMEKRRKTEQQQLNKKVEKMTMEQKLADQKKIRDEYWAVKFGNSAKSEKTPATPNAGSSVEVVPVPLIAKTETKLDVNTRLENHHSESLHSKVEHKALNEQAPSPVIAPWVEAERAAETTKKARAEVVPAEKPEELNIPTDHRVETSAWHTYEVDGQGKAVSAAESSIDYGHEYYRERAAETGPKDSDNIMGAAGEVALVAAALAGKEALPDQDDAPGKKIGSFGSSGGTASPLLPVGTHSTVNEMKPTEKKTLPQMLGAISNPPTTVAGTMTWSVILVILVVIIAIVVF